MNASTKLKVVFWLSLIGAILTAVIKFLQTHTLI